MQVHRILLGLVALLAAALAVGSASAQGLTTKRIASGLNNPLWAGAPVGDDRIFIVEQNGVIKVLEKGTVQAAVFLNITSQVDGFGERGLLGMAFDPNFALNRFFYLNYTNNTGRTIISRWQVLAADPNLADPTSETIVLTQSQPFSNHNGGSLLFGPDGYLYITFGDGGGTNDPNCRAQNPNSWLGKILRIDVSTLPFTLPADNPFIGDANYRPEIYHLGLRNPWRTTLDRLTGDMFIGDVGEDTREEISFAKSGVGGINFGWKVIEGTLCNSKRGCVAAQPSCGSAVYTPPILELSHSGFGGPGSIIGGYVYRGCAIPTLDGTYFYADYVDNQIRSVRYDVASASLSQAMDRTAELAPSGGVSIRKIASFGEDGYGELLIIEHRPSPGGRIYKIVQAGSFRALSSSRNGSGANANCFVSQSLPIIGNRLRLLVDANAHAGASTATIQGFSSPASGIFLNGNELLVDLTSFRYFSLSKQVINGMAQFTPIIPCDQSLGGLSVSSQAVILGGGSFSLCNAIDLTLGGY